MTFVPTYILDHQAKGIFGYLCVVLQLCVPQLLVRQLFATIWDHVGIST